MHALVSKGCSEVQSNLDNDLGRWGRPAGEDPVVETHWLHGYLDSTVVRSMSRVLGTVTRGAYCSGIGC